MQPDHKEKKNKQIKLCKRIYWIWKIRSPQKILVGKWMYAVRIIVLMMNIGKIFANSISIIKENIMLQNFLIYLIEMASLLMSKFSIK